MKTYNDKIIRPCKRIYIVAFNVFPILLFFLGVIFYQSKDIGSLLIFMMVAIYIIVMALYIKNSFLVIQSDGILIHNFFKTSKLIKFSEIVDLHEVYIFSKVPNSLKLAVKDSNGILKDVTIKASWYGDKDVQSLISALSKRGGDN